MLPLHRVRTLLPASFILSFLSLSLTPSFVSLTFLLTSLLLYTREPHLVQNRLLNQVYLWITLTASIALSNFQPTIHALSTPSTSLISLILLSGFSSLLALVPIIARHSIPTTGSQMRLIVFPTLWTVTWLGISSISPIGRLVTWTPLSGVESYQWIRPFFGLSGLDWIVAAWATVAAELIGNADNLNEMYAPLVDIGREEAPKAIQVGPKRLAPLTGILLALTVPSFLMNPFPLPPLSPFTTPLGVACIIPQGSEGSQLERFLTETKKYTSSAKILIWPESAVIFETNAEKEEALEKVSKITGGPGGQHVWIGVSFEERIPGSDSGRDGLHRNGLALVGPNGVEMTYYKRKLVPIAESFSQISSSDPPTIHTIDLPQPKGASKEEWGQTRPIPLSASICLDFSSPLTSLPSRPALILAPAKTWHVDVGRAMYALARARGDELGADVLWCDGGAGGLSGVAGDVQVGTGSWVKTIGIPYPVGKGRTLYGICGDWLVLAAFWGVPGLIFMMGRNMSDAAVGWRRHGHHLLARIRGAVRRAPPVQSESLLDAPVPSG